MTVPFNPGDPTQSSFLAVLSSGEGHSLYQGYGTTPGGGPVDLTSAPQDEYGFPQWAGSLTNAGPTHAAGYYQFEPQTWDNIAGQYGLNFGSKSGQDAGAWYLAQQKYTAATGGDLYSALKAGDYSTVQSALQPTWPSVSKDNFSAGAALTGGIQGAIGGATTAVTGGLSQLGVPGASAINGVITWATTHWIEVLVVIGVAGVAIFSVGALFKSHDGGGSTKIVPIPV